VIVENRILKVYVGYLVEENCKKTVNLEENKPKKKKTKRKKPK